MNLVSRSCIKAGWSFAAHVPAEHATGDEDWTAEPPEARANVVAATHSRHP
jgi:hypothetical protein